MNTNGNNQKKTILLATFTEEKFLDNVVGKILQCFSIENDKIYVFEEEKNTIKKIVTYNAYANADGKVVFDHIQNTIRINRKKDSNTLYTINALNAIIEEKTGRIDESYNIDWEEYHNMLILCDKKYKKIMLTKTRFYAKVDRKEFIEKGTVPKPKRNYNNPQYKY